MFIKDALYLGIYCYCVSVTKNQKSPIISVRLCCITFIEQLLYSYFGLKNGGINKSVMT